jgi:hypothetical protein
VNTLVFPATALDQLLGALSGRGFRLVGPVVRDGAIVYDDLTSTADLPAGRIYRSMERNMQCAAALCGHCQFGPFLVCRGGPVFRYADLARWLTIREL